MEFFFCTKSGKQTSAHVTLGTKLPVIKIKTVSFDFDSFMQYHS